MSQLGLVGGFVGFWVLTVAFVNIGLCDGTVPVKLKREGM